MLKYEKGYCYFIRWIFNSSINVFWNNWDFFWFTKESIDAFGVLVTATVALDINIFAVWKKTYVKTD
ncbi:hypothetical protein [Metabacillus niabensis]|uniref:hypothetical protein n=1 Tax=Metabacillus niabensis TaxID=324854 RepID=UPI001CFBDF0B|nr:hypothetical protein [Metabacillus niabensis]